MPFISKKYFHALSPSVFGPYIIGIQSDKHELTYLRGRLHMIYGKMLRGQGNETSEGILQHLDPADPHYRSGIRLRQQIRRGAKAAGS